VTADTSFALSGEKAVVANERKIVKKRRTTVPSVTLQLQGRRELPAPNKH
jgi:hypothetical protein